MSGDSLVAALKVRPTGWDIMPAVPTFEFSSPASRLPSTKVIVSNATHRALVVSVTLTVNLMANGTVSFISKGGRHTIQLAKEFYDGVITLELEPGSVANPAQLSVALEGHVPDCRVNVLSVAPVS